MLSSVLKPNMLFPYRKKGNCRRDAAGFQLVEMLVTTIVGAFLLTSAYSTAMTMYRASSGGQNQMLASNMAQQVLDNARSSTYGYLRDTLLGGAAVPLASQSLTLYAYPKANPSFFPRPLLKNLADTTVFQYSPTAQTSTFNGTVTETLLNLTPNNLTNGQIQVLVDVVWSDSCGPHNYRASTVISQTGIHN